MNRQNGQSLIEVLVALSILLVVLSAITAIVLSSLNQAVNSSNVTQATQYAQEGMEAVRGRGGFSSGEVYCLGEDTEDFQEGACQQANLGIFKREVTVGNDSCGTLRKVTVTVSWTDGKCGSTAFCHSVPVTTCL